MLAIGDSVSTTLTQYKPSGAPYNCPFTGKVIELKEAEIDGPIARVEGTVHLDIGPAARWGWFRIGELKPVAAGNQLRLLY